jgi:dTDP-4-dehydrorhamnose 3,5-epimerase
MTAALPLDVRVLDLGVHDDARGALVEIYRESWCPGGRAVQWNMVRNRPRVLRGVHVHSKHTDYLLMVSGTLLVGLHDIRPASPTNGVSALVELNADAAKAIVIPPGVTHGFYSADASIHIYGTTEYWSPADELGCRFDSPELHLAWPEPDPVLSDRDRRAGGYADMVSRFLGTGLKRDRA